MVRAILAGAKTQTRRIVRKALSVSDVAGGGGEPAVWWPIDANGQEKAPYGDPPNRLWVRETFRLDEEYDGMPPSVVGVDTSVAYEADGEIKSGSHGPQPFTPGRSRPSIFLPRWASRIALEVTGVRCERLQDISEADAKAEGLKAITKDGGRTVKFGIPDRDGWPGMDDDGWPWSEWQQDPRAAYATLWDSINGKRAPWASNPWVWVVEFRRVP